MPLDQGGTVFEVSYPLGHTTVVACCGFRAAETRVKRTARNHAKHVTLVSGRAALK